MQQMRRVRWVIMEFTGAVRLAISALGMEVHRSLMGLRLRGRALLLLRGLRRLQVVVLRSEVFRLGWGWALCCLELLFYYEVEDGG